jgi:eukaryotic-like serine/threonine-protein kinase
MLTIAAGVAGFSVGTGIVAVAGGFPSGNEVGIPGVIGRDPSKATAILAAADLKATIRYEAGLNAADRRVRAQSPSPGEKEPLGSTVVLTVAARSPGPVLVRVPNVAGVSVEVADAKLREGHLTPGEETVREASGTVPSGKVIGSTPAAGASVKEGSTVALKVSLGPPAPVLVRVPNVEGVSVEVADAKLRAIHLTPREEMVRERSGTVPSGEVIGSTPVAGASVKEGSTVALKVSTGAPPAVLVMVPNVAGVSVGVADAKLRASHLTPGEETVRERSGTVPSGEVIGSTPVAGASVKESSTVTLKVSTGPESN